MAEMKKNEKTDQKKRIRVVWRLILLLVLVFVVRLFYLQVVAGDFYRQKAVSQRRKTMELVPRRGLIYDRNQNPLALSVTVNTCYFFPKEVEKENRAETTNLLSHIFGIEKSVITEALDGKSDIVRLKTKLSQREMDQLKSSGLRCYSIEQESDRYYPYGTMLSQTLGFVNADGYGVYGLESYYDERLRGDVGQQVDSRDLDGNVIPTATDYASRTDAKAGDDLYLTIDLDIQRIVSEELAKAYQEFNPASMTAVIMDANSGAIVATESLPNFNPNTPREPVSDQERALWNGLNEKQQLDKLYRLWKNPAVTDLYEPGSVFKAVTSAISLETKSNRPSSLYHCEGSIDIADSTKIYCVRYYDPHGDQTLEQALANSCNPAFVQIVREVGAASFYSYCRSLRMGQLSGVDLPGESEGLFPKTLDEMDSARMATMSYGHGVSVTPIQMLAAVNATVNGGYYYRPYLLTKVSGGSGKPVENTDVHPLSRLFSEETSKIMREYLVNAVQNGASTAVNIDGYTVGGKSGTTTKLVEGEYVTDQTVSSFFACYPGDQPRYSILVVADNPTTAHTGNEVAGECIRRILSRLIDLETNDSSKRSTQQGLIEVPNVVGMTVEEADGALAEKGLDLSVYGDMGRFVIVGKQTPEAGKVVSPGALIEVTPGEQKRVKVPDFQGLTDLQVENKLKNGGIQVVLNGAGKVYEQNPEKGAVISADDVVELTLRGATE